MTRFEVVIFTWHYGTHKTSGARTAKGFLQAEPSVCVLSRTHRKTRIPTSSRERFSHGSSHAFFFLCVLQ